MGKGKKKSGKKPHYRFGMAPPRHAPANSAPAHEDPPPPPPPPAPHPSFIQVAKPYIFERTIQECFQATGADPLREDNNRLQGVAWIDVRKALQLYEAFLFSLDALFFFLGRWITDWLNSRPVRTFNTACVYFHKFRLVHSDNEYNYVVR
jgi:CTD kinase subunit beta